MDPSSAATDITDALHERTETVEDRLFGERRDWPERPGQSTQSGPDSVVLGRLALLEAFVEVIEQAAARDLRQVHVELTELRGHLKAFMTLLADALLARFGLDLRAKVWERLRTMA